MASSAAPLVKVMRIGAGPVGTAGNDLITPVGVVDVAGTITTVSIVPNAVITGAATNNRKHTLYNRGGAGAGTTAVASRQYVSGTNAAIKVATDLTLSGTAADLVVAVGDVLEFESLHILTGIADPGETVEVTISRVQSE